MNIGRTLTAVVGLVFLVLAYVFHSILFLAATIIAFAVGLWLMGAIGRHKVPPSQNPRKNQSGNPKPKRKQEEKKQA